MRIVAALWAFLAILWWALTVDSADMPARTRDW